MLLEKKSTRKVFRRVRDDSSSLYVQRDSTSLYSRYTDNLSKISKVFEFDRELFVSKVYEIALRSSLKDTVENLRRHESHGDSSPEEKERTKLIDRQLEEDSRRLRRECKVLLLGDRDCGQSYMQQMRIAHGHGFNTEELGHYQAAVTNNVWDIIKTTNYIVQKFDTELDETTKIHARLLSQELKNDPTDNTCISIGAAEAIQRLWASEQFSKFLESADVHIPDSAHNHDLQVAGLYTPFGVFLSPLRADGR